MKTQYTQTQHGTNGTGPTSKSPSHRDKILALLRERGPNGATNVELNRIGFRYGGRVHELRGMGYVIRTDRLEPEGLFRFVLVEEPEHVKELPTFQPKPRDATTPSLFPEGTL